MQRVLIILLLVFSTGAWGAEPQQPVLRLETGMHTALVRRLATDASGRWLVSASDDKTVRVWDLEDGNGLLPAKILRPPIGKGHEGKIYGVALSPDGRTVACGGWTGWEQEKKASIYLFDRSSGELTKRLSGFPNIVKGLAFSSDGRYLAVIMGAGKGVAILRTADWQPVALDSDYGDDAYGVTFDNSGRLATSAWDGFVRLYDREFRLVAKKRFANIARPYDLAFSPDGGRLAVGNSDTPHVAVLSGLDLSLLIEPDTKGLGSGALVSVAWSPDGGTLYGAGSCRSSGSFLVRTWADGGKGRGVDLPLAGSSIQHLLALADGSIAYAAASPELGVAGPGGKVKYRLSPAFADFREGRSDLRVSVDGATVQFRGADGGMRLFSLRDRILTKLPERSPQLLLPVAAAGGLEVSDWQDSTEPKLNARKLRLDQFEVSRSMAVAGQGAALLLGTDWTLRCFDRAGKEQWQVSAPGTVWSVNSSATGLVTAAMGDGTIRWYRLQDGRELLALFPHADGRRWVLWTPSGYYDAAPGAEELVGWHLNAGSDKAADFFGVARFRADYYRPDVVAVILELKDEQAALNAANGRGGARQKSRSVQKLLPPVAVIVSPENLSLLDGEEALLTVVVRSPSGEPVTGLKVLAGGRPAAARIEVVAGQPDKRLVHVRVGEGDAELAVIAENRNGAGEPAIIHLRRATVAAQDDGFSIQPKLYMLAVGVGAYPDKDLQLAFAAKDARDFAVEFMKQKGGLYRDVTIKVITDSSATREAVLDGLEWLQRQATAKDVAILFLAGHGVTDPNGVYYYLPVNADLAKLKSTGIIFTEIRNSLMALAGKALLFVDTCHSGNVMGSRRAVADINAVVNELASAEIGTVVFASSTGRQYSLEDESWGNGAFTKALLEGVSGKADFTGKGRITINMLDLYLAERVKELTDGRQTPTTAKPQTVPDFPIAVVR
ncbi:putative WD repeat-containing protein alr2800 [Geobacter sp. OR-1]|uniref:caspase family protein n=1 Tax=Geobacter sp. OR-1 TaxID=1266765 RepID=UPI00054346F1|nr:caspase family protein [Geobacter sp. OR-1]GAM09469.1 putative WD repeat-containing protein alr2800 [Geobacter sp. OR-1]